MKVFISWSGQQSKKVAELLTEWLPDVIQPVKPWISQEIEKGAQWFTEISNNLENTEIGIICLTKENMNAPWILFEAGALFKGLEEARIYTLLLDLEPNDVKHPLAAFNATLLFKDDMRKLIKNINSKLPEEAVLSDERLDRTFEKNWLDFESKFSEIIQHEKRDDEAPLRSTDSMLNEILSTIRSLDQRQAALDAARIRQAKMMKTLAVGTPSMSKEAATEWMKNHMKKRKLEEQQGKKTLNIPRSLLGVSNKNIDENGE